MILAWRADSEMAAYFHQFYFPDLEVRLAAKQILEASRENGIGEKTSACRRG